MSTIQIIGILLMFVGVISHIFAVERIINEKQGKKITISFASLSGFCYVFALILSGTMK